MLDHNKPNHMLKKYTV